MTAGFVREEAVRPRVWTPPELGDDDGPLLLDTHVWLWHLEGTTERLAARTHGLLERSGARSNLLVSDISYWEVAVMAAKGRMTFAVDVAIWLQRAEQAPGIRFRPLDRAVLLLSTRLPGQLDGDPADRMLIAAAQLDAVPLVTADGATVDYAATNAGTPVVDVR